MFFSQEQYDEILETNPEYAYRYWKPIPDIFGSIEYREQILLILMTTYKLEPKSHPKGNFWFEIPHLFIISEIFKTYTEMLAGVVLLVHAQQLENSEGL